MRESGNNLIRRKLFSLETLAEGPARVRSATFDKVTGILFWHENANFAITLNLHVSLVGFQKFFLFWVSGIISKIQEAELGTGVVMGIYC